MRVKGSRAVFGVVGGVLAAIVPGVHAAPAPASIPAEALAVLDEHIGKWRTEGTFVTPGGSQPASATWACERAVGGVGVVCSWEHFWPGGRSDKALELIGWDTTSGKLTWARVTDQGSIRVTANEIRGNTIYTRWESAQDGKPLVGVNEVFMKPGEDEWTQKMTVDVGGARVSEMNLTHHRVK